MKNIEDLNVSTIQSVHKKVFYLPNIFPSNLEYYTVCSQKSFYLPNIFPSNLNPCFFTENLPTEKRRFNTILAKLITWKGQ